MKNRHAKSLILYFTVLLLLKAIPISAQSDNIQLPKKHVIYFRINESDINTNFKNNKPIFQKLSELFENNYINIDSIKIITTASPDGKISFNKNLAEERASKFKQYIIYNYPQIKPGMIKTSSFVEKWKSLSVIVTNDTNIPLQDKVLQILNSNDPETVKTGRLKSIDKGRPYMYLANKILEEYRKGDCYVYWSEPKIQPDKPIIIRDTILPPPREIENEYPETLPDKKAELTSKSKSWLIKTNMAYLAATVANIGVEFSLNDHLSLNIPFLYSPYMISRKYRMEVLGFQPEIRYWLSSVAPMQGHFFGFHIHTAWYTVSINKKARYQDKDGDTPLWGAGFSYGYAHSLNNRWGLEFTLGAGYANIEYDTFHNYHNGAKYDTNTRKYWGLTNLGITLVYKLNLK